MKKFTMIIMVMVMVMTMLASCSNASTEKETEKEPVVSFSVIHVYAQSGKTIKVGNTTLIEAGIGVVVKDGKVDLVDMDILFNKKVYVDTSYRLYTKEDNGYTQVGKIDFEAARRYKAWFTENREYIRKALGIL